MGYLNIVSIAAEGDRHHYTCSFQIYFAVNIYLVYYTLKQNASKNTIFFAKNSKSRCRKINLSVQPWKFTINYKDANALEFNKVMTLSKIVIKYKKATKIPVQTVH